MEIGISGGSKNTAAAITDFYGLNRCRRPVRGEMTDMENMSSNEFPCAAPRGGRDKVFETENEILAITVPEEAFSNSIDGFTGIAGNVFYYNGVRKTTICGSRYDKELEIDLPDGCEWKIEKMGDLYLMNGYNKTTNKSCMFYYDAETDRFGYGGRVMPMMIISIGTETDSYSPYYQKHYIEALPYWGKAAGHTITYSDGTQFKCSDYGKLYGISSGYITTTQNLFTQYFKTNDELSLEGFRNENAGQNFSFGFDDEVVPENRDIDYESIAPTDISDMASTDHITADIVTSVRVLGFSNVTNLNSRHKMYVSVKNIKNEELYWISLGSDAYPSYYAGVTISKKMPAFSTIGLHQGRVWGATPSGRYVYSSASDDIFSFSSADLANQFAWRMPMQEAGPVTGMVSHNGEFLIYKSRAMSIITGTSAKNYQMYTIPGIGCISPTSVISTQKGAVFLSHNGFYIYNGSYPKVFGSCLKGKYKDAVAGYDGRKCYISATDIHGDCEMLVYDTVYGTWHREDDFKASGYFRFRDKFYVCDKNAAYSMGGDNKDVTWSMTFSEVGDYELGGINEIWVRAQVDDGAEFTVLSDSGNGDWKEHTTFSQHDGIAVYRSPVRLKRSDGYRIQLRGRGNVVVYSIELISASGGRRHKERE